LPALSRSSVPRSPALRGAIIWAVGVAPWPAVAKPSEQWRVDIPRAVKGLKEFQADWADISLDARATEGANRVREGLMIKYKNPLAIQVPAGKPLGVKVNAYCTVTAVKDPTVGLQEEDTILTLNDASTQFNDKVLAELTAEARAAKQPVKLTLQRIDPPLLDNLESKLKDAYLALGDDSLPELEEVQVAVGAARSAATAAASAPSVTAATMQGLRAEIDKLIRLLTPYVAATE